MENKKWNVVATLAVILVLIYSVAAIAAFLMGKIDFATFRDTMLSVLLPVLGYLARMLGEPKTP